MVKRSIICVIVFIHLILRIENVYSKNWKSKCPELDIPNANIRIRAKGRLAKIRCDSGYTMIEGDRRLSCIRKEWQGRIPLCIRSGCDAVALENGMAIKLYAGALVHFVCNPGYSLEGSAAVFCDGFNWNSTTPECRVPLPKPDHLSCNFEYQDLCGWTQDHLDDFDWKWDPAHIIAFQGGFGAKKDHTLGSIIGHYVYADSNEKWTSKTFARLFSPILEVPSATPACVTFYYHLYGPTSGVFRVYIKPESVLLEQLFPDMSVTGFHADEWLMAFLHLDDSLEDLFQIVLEAQGGDAHVSDFAVDDFKVSSGEECINLELKYKEQQRSTTQSSNDEVEESTIFSSSINTPIGEDEEDISSASSVLPTTFKNLSVVTPKFIKVSTEDDEDHSFVTSSSSFPYKEVNETMTTPRKIIFLTTSKTLIPRTLFTPITLEISSTLKRKTLTPSILTTNGTTTTTTTENIPMKITPKPTTLKTKSTTISINKVPLTTTTSLTTATQTTTTLATTSAKATTTTSKTTTKKRKITSTTTSTKATKKTTTAKTTTPKTKTTRAITSKKPRKTTTTTTTAEISSTERYTTNKIITRKSSPKRYKQTTTTRKTPTSFKPIFITENVDSVSLKKENSSGGVIAVILALAICCLVIGSVLAFLWHRKRKMQLLDEDSDVRRLKEESKDEEQNNETEEASRRTFATSYRLLENRNYPQEYDGTPV